MASVEQIGNKLLRVLQENKKNNESRSSDEKQGCAIALAGEWGIGKTHFWDIFKKGYLEGKGRKIAYVSLFGIESLSDLKYEIGIKTKSSEVSEKDDRKNLKVKNMLKGILNNIKIPGIESNGFVFSLSQNIVTSAIFGLVKDTIICIDDLERKSDKLDLKDVMGLVNQLKLEKNCQVIVILHEDKAGEQYQEYKEKVFDDVFYLTENFKIIKEIIDNNEVVHIYQEFYDKLQVKNLRFYERVNKDYNEIVSLVNDLTITSKEHILRSVLVVRYADFFAPKIEYKDNDMTVKNIDFDLDFLSNIDVIYQERNKENSIIKSSLNNYFKKFVSFYGVNNWIKIVFDNIVNYNDDFNVLSNMAKNEEISEKQKQAKLKYVELISELENIEVEPGFIERFYDVSKMLIGYENYSNLSNCYKILLCGNKDYSDKFKKLVESDIQKKIEYIISQNRQPKMKDFYHNEISYPNDIFYNFIENKINELEIHNNQNEFDLCSFFLNYSQHDNYDESIINKVENIKKDELSQVVWLKNDNLISRKNLIRLILLNKYFSDEKREQIRQWIIELLNEKIQENPDSELAVKFWLTHTENLTKF